jgi:hypothetical protein
VAIASAAFVARAGIALPWADEVLPTTEENGILIINLTPEDITICFFKWRHDPVKKIDILEPFSAVEPRLTA